MAYPKKLSESDIKEILDYKKKGMSNVAIARIFLVSETAIRKVLLKFPIKPQKT